MTKTNNKIRLVTTWLSKLAMMTAEGATPVSKERIGVLALALAEDLPETAFTEKSLEDTAAGNEYFPAYAVLKTALQEWARIAALEGKLLIAAPAADEPMAAYWVDDWQDPAIIRASLAKLEGHPMKDMLGRLFASVIRRHAPHNLGFIPAEWQEPSQ